ncbi:MAG: hypothetical protein JXA57_10550 [Armatimonadetes bacterium]|nr:hypothetical protein [Armatimonadota bacterium]
MANAGEGHINSSGFPLQIGLEHAINASCHSHGWSVLHTEHGWLNSETGESGFIDLVVHNQAGTIVLNVECKRPQDCTWQFLLPAPNDGPEDRAKFWASNMSKAGVRFFDWLDLHVRPVSFESAFCVVAGQDSKTRPMLERIAAQVVESTEALAREEALALERQDSPQLRTYFNVIVTTARLEVCRFDPSEVDLDTGKVDSISSEEVPFIRFRKQLSPRPKLPENLYVSGLWTLARAKENTVFVVQANSFLDFIRQIHLSQEVGRRVAGNS